MTDVSARDGAVFRSTDEQRIEEPTVPPSGGPPRRWFLSAAIGVLLFAYVVWRPHGEDRSRGRHHVAVGTSLDWTDLEPLVNADFAVRADDVAGRVTLVNFWGPWCPPCREEFPHLLALRREFAHEPRLKVVLVACAGGPDEPLAAHEQATRRYLEQLGTDAPIHVDPQAAFRLRLVRAAKMENFGYPATIVLDGRGVMRGVWVGYYQGEEQRVAELMRELLAEGKPL